MFIDCACKEITVIQKKINFNFFKKERKSCDFPKKERPTAKRGKEDRAIRYKI